MNHYIYAHFTKDTHEIFYIGQGMHKRAWHTNNRTALWNNVSKKHGYYVVILKSNLTKSQANDLERFWISLLGRRDLNEGNLVNLTAGGEGPFNISDESNAKRAAIHLGAKRSDATRKKISDALKRARSSEEAKKTQSERSLQMWKDTTIREKAILSMKSVKKTLVTCEYCKKQMHNSHIVKYGHDKGNCIIPEKSCPECNNMYTSKTKFCSQTCRSIYYNRIRWHGSKETPSPTK